MKNFWQVSMMLLALSVVAACGPDCSSGYYTNDPSCMTAYGGYGQQGFGYGAPVGYGAPNGYGMPPGYGYGTPGYGVPPTGFNGQPGYGVPPTGYVGGQPGYGGNVGLGGNVGNGYVGNGYGPVGYYPDPLCPPNNPMCNGYRP